MYYQPLTNSRKTTPPSLCSCLYKNCSQVYHTETDVIPLPSQVQKQRLEVDTIIFRTGKFAPGVYDVNEKPHLIEREFGLLKKDGMNPKKGGTIRLGEGSNIIILPNALNEQTLIGNTTTRKIIRGIDDDKGFRFNPHGTLVIVPIKVALDWEEFEGQKVIFSYFNEQSQQWEVIGECIWDGNYKILILFLYHFFRYALIYA